jgi:hypothetical protein
MALMNRYCVICDGYIVNTVVWDGVEEWEPGEGCIALPEAEAVQQYEYLPVPVLEAV